MSFEIDTFHVIVPLDPNDGDKYNEPINEYSQRLIIKNIYNITGCKDNNVNPTADGKLSWRSVYSYDMDY
jgi:hypothetical protein